MVDNNLNSDVIDHDAMVGGVNASLGSGLESEAALSADTAEQISAFEQILQRFEENTLTERDKGTAFELLVRDVFSSVKPWGEQFEKVQTYADWAKEHPKLTSGNARDTGIDLVATNRVAEDGQAQNAGIASQIRIESRGGVNGLGDNVTQSFTAIQCKFFGRNYTIPKSQIDSFLAASDQDCFTRRIFVCTGNLTDNARNELQNRTKPVECVSRTDLEEANVDWSGFLKTNQVTITKRKLRPYQEEALENVLEGFKHHNRGKLIMACGTGKTFTSLKIAERQTNNNGLVLFLMPSLALLSQTLYDWKRQSSAPMTAFAVCSDSKVGKNGDEDDFASYMRPTDLNFPATTDAKSLAKAVNQALSRKEQTHAEGMTVIFSTYQSLDVIHQAQTDYQLPALDLIICDEAHRTAGGYLVAERKSVKKTATAMSAPLIPEVEPITLEPVPVLGAAPEPVDGAGVVEARSSTNQEIKPEPAKRGRKPRVRRGADSAVDDESNFTRIHDDDYIKGAKRLYMTATPKVYGDAAKQQESVGEAILYSMDDENVFGPVFSTLNFDRAVKLGCLVDYKVIILVGDKSLLPTDEALLDFSQYQAAKVIGTWKALNKYGVSNELTGDEQPMRRAVGFAQIIDSTGKYDKAGSKQFTEYFQNTVEHYREHIKELSLSDPQGRASEEFAYLNDHNLVCDCKHIDGSMDAITKSQLLDWLRTDPEENHCKILFNVRCLSEGVDVPALDAVVFLSPRKSQVDVVQTVGRVMRTAPGKTRGYVIIPVVTNDLEHPESIFDKNQSFDVVWQVLNALKSINPDHVLVDGVTQKIDERIEVICVQKDPIKGKSSVIREPRPPRPPKPSVDPVDPDKRRLIEEIEKVEQAIKVEETIKSTIIKRLGRRKEWHDWAEDVAKICTEQVKAINKLLDANQDPDFQAEFAKFCLDLNDSIGQHLDREEIIEMLAQHIVIKPVLDELFRGFPFTEQNPIAKGLSDMLEKLDAEGLTKTNQDLRGFYQSVEFRMQNVTTVEDRQKVIVDLFDRFFKVAFPKQQDKLGIVYTPIEVVDFINHSVNDILKKEFGSSLGSKGVHIMDPFTGTGTFITRMMQSPELISAQELEYKYRHELHAQEILPLAYYVASINIESVYHDLMGKDASHYERNHIVVLTDTFSEVEDKAHSLTGSFGDNSVLRDAVRALPLKVIVGNPPYSVGQSSVNDDNQNESYPSLEKRIAETYAASGIKTTKKSLYDSYVKAFRWASDRLGDQGVIAFVSNASWIDTAASCGLRRCLQQEFSSIYVYHLKGNQRTSGEQSRKEGGKIFGAGSRAPIAITILVKNPQSQAQGKIYFAAVDDYLSREEKLGQLVELGVILNAPLVEIQQDAHGDWLAQRRDDFSNFIRVDSKNTYELAIFDNYSCGVVTGRDAWSYNASKIKIEANFKRCIALYNSQVDALKSDPSGFVRDNDETKIKWNTVLVNRLNKLNRVPEYTQSSIICSLYRPFVRLWFYNEKAWVHSTYQMEQLFPFNGADNLILVTTGGGTKDFSCLFSTNITCYDFLEKGQCFPRYLYRKVSNDSAKDAGGLMAGLEFDSEPKGKVINGYERVDAIRPEAVEHFKAAYPEEAAAIDVDAVFYYIYGILHSPDYRSTYANNLQKELPRIPRVATYAEFKAFEDAGRKLAKLHVGYESVEPYAGCTFSYAKGISSDNMDYRVEKLKYGKVAGKKGNAAKDKTVIVYNDMLTIRNIPIEAQEYVVNKKSALDWIVERCGVSVDKASHIINDYNDYAAEMGDEQYILNLILRVITVSLETVKIVKSLPPLTIHKLDQ